MPDEGPEQLGNERFAPDSASALIPHFSRLRDIRNHYSRLEEAKYGAPWGVLEQLDGTKGDIGRLSKLETGRRGMRDGSTPELLEHEVVDCVWSLVISADSNHVDSALACAKADKRGRLEGEPRQLINRLSLMVALIDEAVDPPQDPLFAHDTASMGLVGYYAEAFRAIVALSPSYGIELPQAIVRNMDTLEQRINAELTNL